MTHNNKGDNLTKMVSFVCLYMYIRTDRVTGLTTAAGIWIVAAIGYGVAAGYYYLGIMVTVLVLVVQFGFLFFLSPRFWRDLKEKFRMSYDMEVPIAEQQRQEEEEARSRLTDPSRVSRLTRSILSNPGRDSQLSNINDESVDQIESGKPGILNHDE